VRKRFGIFAIAALLIAGVLVVLFKPIATHSVVIDIPSDLTSPRINRSNNTVEITAHDEILWNGTQVTLAQLKEALDETREFPVEPALQFIPDQSASYDLSANVLKVIKDSNVTKFGFVGNEKY